MVNGYAKGGQVSKWRWQKEQKAYEDTLKYCWSCFTSDVSTLMRTVFDVNVTAQYECKECTKAIAKVCA